MRAADSWKDYELLDATGGNRLERWGSTLLVRPDPQVVWKSAPQSPLWGKADAVYHRSRQGGGSWEYRRPHIPRKVIPCLFIVRASVFIIKSFKIFLSIFSFEISFNIS